MKKVLYALITIIGFGNATMAQVPSYVPTNGLVGWWPFNGNANDESGNGNHGIPQNGTVLSNDRFNNSNRSYSFDGVNDYMSTPIIQSNINSYSVSIWFKTTDSIGLMFQGSRNCNSSIGTRLVIYLNKLLYGADASGYNDAVVTNSSFNDNQWHNVVGVWNGFGSSTISQFQFSIYVDGVLVSQTAQTSVGNGGIGGHRSIPINGTSTCSFGKESCNSSTFYYSGLLDDIGIWSRALTQQEITNLYNNFGSAQHNTKIHVAINGKDSGSIGYQNAPFRKIQSAINYALDGDTIIVHPGRYKENLLVDAKDIYLYSEFQSNKDSSLLYTTIMDGDSMANTLILRDFNGELNGFTIERGVSNYGAGLHVLNSNTPIIRNCIIQKNRGCCDITGHGVVLNATNGLMENCIVRDNWGDKWTIIVGGWSTFRNCEVYNNTALAPSEGSNLVITGPANVYNVIVHHNYGVGMEIRFINSPDTANIHNINILNNSDFGIRIVNCHAKISNSIIFGNATKNILLVNTIAPNKTQLEIDYCIVGGGADSVLTNVYKVLTYGTHNINALPRFKSAWDFHLDKTSPAIGKGKNVVTFTNFSHTVFPFDYDGNPRPNPVGSTPDIGAYENILGTPIDTSCNYIFTTMPISASKPKGASHIFNSFHNGNYSYQWQADAAGLGWQNVSNMNQYSGANGNNLTVNNISVSNHNQRFRVIAFKTGCADTSNVANLQVADTCLTTVTDTLIIKTTVGLPTPNTTNTLLIYPNPAKDRITIDNGNYTVMAGYSIKIENSLGQQVFNSAITQAQFNIDLSTWTGKGIYFVRVLDTQGNVVTTRKILLQ